MRMLLSILMGCMFSGALFGQGTIRGIVTGRGSPLIGAGIEVYDFKSSEVVASGITAPNGSYEIGGLEEGRKYWIKFCSPDYVPKHVEIIASNEENPKLIHTENRARWEEMGRHIAADVKTSTSQDTTFYHAWAKLDEPAYGKVIIAQTIEKEFNGSAPAKSVPGFLIFAQANRENVEKAERIYWEKGTGPDFYNLHPQIQGDIRTAYPPQIVGFAGPCSSVKKSFEGPAVKRR